MDFTDFKERAESYIDALSRLHAHLECSENRPTVKKANLHRTASSALGQIEHLVRRFEGENAGVYLAAISNGGADAILAAIAQMNLLLRKVERISHAHPGISIDELPHSDESKDSQERTRVADGPCEGENIAGSDYRVVFPLGEDLTPSRRAEEVFAHAVYERDESGSHPIYRFMFAQRAEQGKGFEIEFIDGPMKGVHCFSHALQLHDKVVRVPLDGDQRPVDGLANVASVADYQRKNVEGVWKMALIHVSDAVEDLANFANTGGEVRSKSPGLDDSPVVFKIGNMKTLPIYTAHARTLETIAAYSKGKAKIEYADPEYSPPAYSPTPECLRTLNQDSRAASQAVRDWTRHLSNFQYYSQFKDDETHEKPRKLHEHVQLISALCDTRLGIDTIPFWEEMDATIFFASVHSDYRADPCREQNYKKHADRLGKAWDKVCKHSVQVASLTQRIERIIELRGADWSTSATIRDDGTDTSKQDAEPCVWPANNNEPMNGERFTDEQGRTIAKVDGRISLPLYYLAGVLQSDLDSSDRQPIKPRVTRHNRRIPSHAWQWKVNPRFPKSSSKLIRNRDFTIS